MTRWFETTPRQLQERGLWDRAMNLLPTLPTPEGGWVYAAGLRSYDEQLLITADEAQRIGFALPVVPWWRRIALWFGYGSPEKLP